MNQHTETSAKLSNALTEMTLQKAAEDKLKMAEREIKQSQQYGAQSKAADTRQKLERGSDDEEDDPDFRLDEETEKRLLEKMKAERLEELMEQKKEKTKQKADVWYGEYTEITEDEFLPYVTKAKYAVCHFYHNDFEKCKIMDQHLQILTQTHKETKFLKLNAEKAPFFVKKLAIRVLPSVCYFKDGILVETQVGFEDLGNSTENFQTVELARKMVKAGVIKAKTKAEKGFSLIKGKGRDDDSGDDSDY